MGPSPTDEVLRWVQEGERLFGDVLQTLHRYQEVEMKAKALEGETQRMREEIQANREELRQLRAERLEAAESFKAIAEHVTRLATMALQRLGKPAA